MFFAPVWSFIKLSTTVVVIAGLSSTVSAGRNSDNSLCSGTVYSTFKRNIPADYLGEFDNKGVYIPGMASALDSHVLREYRDINAQIWVDKTDIKTATDTHTWFNYHLKYDSPTGATYDYIDLALFDNPGVKVPKYVMRIPMKDATSGENCFTEYHNWLPSHATPDTPAWFLKISET